MDLPVQPPVAPQLARSADEVPDGEGWVYEPKWDGFRAIAYRDGAEVELTSRRRRPLTRYFPELVPGLAALRSRRIVLDGEIVIFAREGGRGLDFDALLQRIHPAASRVELLARETPAAFVAFDLLALGATAWLERPQAARRARLEQALAGVRPPVFLTPATTDRAVALGWLETLEGSGLDGVIAKRTDAPYLPGERRGMVKVKNIRTADCVVAGLRWGKAKGTVGSLILGLYDEAGELHFVGHTSSFSAAQKRELVQKLSPLRDRSAFGEHARAPGMESRWSQGRDLEWEPLAPELVCEVAFDHMTGPRIRHGATFLRWRPDKDPRECTFDQVASRAGARDLEEFLAPG